MTTAQTGPYAGAFPVADDGLTSTDEEGGEESSPEHLSGVGAEASLNEVPLAAGGDESIRQVYEAPTSGMHAIDHAHSIIGRNGTGRAHGDLHKAAQMDQPSDGHPEPAAVEPPPVEMPAAEQPDSAGADSPEPAEAPVGASEDYPALREMLRSMPPGSDNAAAPGQMPEQSAEEPGWRRIFRKMAGVK